MVLIDKEKFKNFMVAELYYNLLILYFGKTHRFNHVEYVKTNDITQSSSFTYLEKINFFNIISDLNFSSENYKILYFLKKYIFNDKLSIIEKKLKKDHSSSYKHWFYYSDYYKSKEYLVKKTLKNILVNMKLFHLIKYFQITMKYKKIRYHNFFAVNLFCKNLVNRNLKLINRNIF